MAKYKKKIQKNIKHTNNQPKVVNENKKQIKNMILIFSCITITILAIAIITYFIQK